MYTKQTFWKVYTRHALLSVAVVTTAALLASVSRWDRLSGLVLPPSWRTQKPTSSITTAPGRRIPPRTARRPACIGSRCITASTRTPATSSSASSISTLHTAAPAGDFPAFGTAILPFSNTPNWGTMTSPAQWNRTYAELGKRELVDVPPYDMAVLTTPMRDLTARRESPAAVAAITAKLFYSTRYYGAYDLDSGEFEWEHPGIDLKVAAGTPVGAVGGGRVSTVARSDALGVHVIIEHRLPDLGTVFSVYGHLDAATVREGQDVTAGQEIGTVGMTGNTVSPHLHLQIDLDTGARPHVPYWPDRPLTAKEAAAVTLHPLRFINEH